MAQACSCRTSGLGDRRTLHSFFISLKKKKLWNKDIDAKRGAWGGRHPDAALTQGHIHYSLVPQVGMLQWS